jgi:uncharacterized repeat protein (TIGR03803 family)
MLGHIYFKCRESIIKLTLAINFTLWLFSPSAIAGFSITTIYSFQGTNGLDPESTLIQGEDGSLYGTTRDTVAPWVSNASRLYGRGTIFRLMTNGTFSTVYTFTGTNGAGTRGGLTLGKDGNLYGMTFLFDKTNEGALYKINANGTFTTVLTLTLPAGTILGGLTAGSDGAFYGTSATGGLPKNGRAFGSDYGSGLFDNGFVFKITTNDGFKALSYFNGTNGANPYSGVIQGVDGNLYGSTTCDGLNSVSTNNPGGHGFGSVCKLLQDGEIVPLLIFNGTNGIGPNALIQDKVGTIYGSTQGGGLGYSVTNDLYWGHLVIPGQGTIFRISRSGNFATLIKFYGPNGGAPTLLVMGKDGNVYGLTSSCGAFNAGTFFRLNPNGTFVTLHSFTGKNGDGGINTLMQSSDGSFYGTSGGDGKYGFGSIVHLVITH